MSHSTTREKSASTASATVTPRLAKVNLPFQGFALKLFNQMFRIATTAGVVASAGVEYALNKPATPVLLRETFERLGATYIKLGQFVASSPSFFPPAYVTEFQKCLDQAPPVSFDVIRNILVENFDQPLDQIFESIDPVPLATASIAQVHTARLVSGEDVVIKVQKPDVDTILHTDLAVVHAVAVVLEKIVPKLKFATVSGVVGEIRRRMLKELNFLEEAQNIRDFQEMLALSQNTQVTAPHVYPHASTAKVMTMERMYGVPFTSVEDMKQYCDDPAQVLIVTMNTWFQSLMSCKSFHADLHAGNVMLLTDGRIAFIDFGIVGQLKPEVWMSAIGFMEALQAENYALMAKNMLGMGMTSKQVDLAQLEHDLVQLLNVIQMGKPPTSQMADPVSMMGQADDLNEIMLMLVKIGEQHGIHFPQDFALLMKQMLYFDRFMKVLTPHMDLFADARIQMTRR